MTADGEHIIASAVSHPDLFWALRGGGGGTYGVVTSATIKAFPDTFVSTALLDINTNDTNTNLIHSLIRPFLESLPSIVDEGVSLAWVIDPQGFHLTPVFAPGLNKAALDGLLIPVLSAIDRLGLTYNYSSSEHDDFLSAYQSMPFSWNVADFNVGGPGRDNRRSVTASHGSHPR